MESSHPQTDRPRELVTILRHGEYQQPEGMPSAHLPHPLTRTGETQADLAADCLVALAEEHDCRIDPVLHSSRLLRAWQTAKIIADELTAKTGTSFEVREHEALAERGLGAAANLTLEQIEAVIAADPRYDDLPDRWKHDPEFRLPLQGAESQVEAGKRLFACIRSILDDTRPTASTMKVVVSHGGALRHAAVEMGLLDRSEAIARSMHYAHPIVIERLADGSFAHVTGDWKIRKPMSMRSVP